LQKEGVYFIDEDEKIYNLFKILREKKLFGDKIIYKKLFIKQEIVSKLILLLEDIRFKLANED
jgi:transcription initiation factor IIE alpha subunit